MNKKKLISIFLFVITIFLLVTTFYLNSLLQNDNNNSVTQIKKTKASAQTYHRYLALNSTLPPASRTSSQSSSSRQVPTIKSSLSSIRPTTQPTVIANAIILSQKPTSVTPSSSIYPSVISPTTLITSSQSSSDRLSSSSQGLLTYRNPTSISNISSQIINSSSSNSISSLIKLTITPSISKKLPETGMVQYSSILFIVAVTTIFIAFLY